MVAEIGVFEAQQRSRDTIMTKPSEELLVRGFSCPLEFFDESFMHSLAGGFASGVIELFIDAFGASLSECGTNIVAMLEKVTAKELGFEALWSPAVGRCLKAIKTRDPALARRGAAELLLRLSVNGVAGDWEIRLTKAYRFLCGNLLLPHSDYLAVNYSSRKIDLYAGRETQKRHFTLDRRRKNAETSVRCDALESIPCLASLNSCIALLSEQSISADDHNDYSFPILPVVGQGEFDPFAHTLEFLKTHSPIYYEWVSRIIRQVVIVDTGSDKRISSGSPEGALGSIFISNSKDILSVAEMLIHEAAHNYFYLVTRLGPPDNSTSDQLYYSPFTRTMRPLTRIMLAYHAFANVYIFYRGCLNTTTQNHEVCLRRMKATLEDLRSVEGYIKENKHCTSIGVALMEPLIRELHNE